MLNYYIEKDQEQRIAKAQNAVEEEANRNTDLYSEGKFDGVAGLEPNKNKFVEEAYREGYRFGITQYWLNRFEIKIESPF